MIAAKAKATLEAGRITTFRIGGTCEVLPSEAPIAQSLGVIPPASLPVNSDSAAIPPCPAVNVSQTPPPRAPSLTLLPSLGTFVKGLPVHWETRQFGFLRVMTIVGHFPIPMTLVSSDIKVGAELIRKIGGTGVKFPANEDLLVPDRFLDWSRDLLNIINSGSRIIGLYEAVVAEKEKQIKSLLACTDVDATRKELDRQKARVDSWEVSANANRQSADDYVVLVEVLKEEKHRLEDEVKKRDVHLEAASAEIAGLRANMEKSRFTEDRLRKEPGEARRRADEIASGSSARGARHSAHLEWIHLYLIALHIQEDVKAQLCYRREAPMSLEKMVEAEYELPPSLLENYVNEEE
ncbi:hypothetical protein AALP_AAs53663U000100 [Arabis alpina]|uniref:Uncharacterized protein n=1 Tax=Arabis alpina TaxID=50452 RepID=A0A087FZM4_ARAAL|nr:hypothetical protein AALP_AAs53663U000100 [Arabis alpina]